MKRTSIRTEVYAMMFVFVQKSNETPYVLREGRCFMDPSEEILEGFSERRSEHPFKVKRQPAFRT